MKTKYEFFETDRCVLDTLDLAIPAISGFINICTEPFNCRWTCQSMPLNEEVIIAFTGQFQGELLPFLQQFVKVPKDVTVTDSSAAKGVDSTTTRIDRRQTDQVEGPKRRRSLWKRSKKLARNCIMNAVRFLCPMATFSRD